MRDTTTTITITVEPTGAGMFSATLTGRLLVASSREPLLAAARVLLAEGVDSCIAITMQHAGSSIIALKATIATAAKLTVEDGSTGAPRFRRWRAPCVWGVSPPMRFDGKKAPGIGPAAGACPCEAAEAAP